MSQEELYDGITEFYEKKPNHHYRTEMPNIVLEILKGSELIVYLKIKKIAGDDGECFMTLSNLSKKCGMSLNTLKTSLNKLAQNKNLINKPLISITPRKRSDGSSDTNIITINDVWQENGDFYRSSKLNKSLGGVKISPTSPQNRSTKKNPIASNTNYQNLPKNLEGSQPCESSSSRRDSVLSQTPFYKKVKSCSSPEIKPPETRGQHECSHCGSIDIDWDVEDSTQTMTSSDGSELVKKKTIEEMQRQENETIEKLESDHSAIKTSPFYIEKGQERGSAIARDGQEENQMTYREYQQKMETVRREKGDDYGYLQK